MTAASSGLRPSVTAGLIAAGLDPDDTERVVRTALHEDLRYGPDITTAATIPVDAVATADVVSRQRGVVAGIPVALAVLDVAGVAVDDLDVAADDGAIVGPGDRVLSISGSLGGLLGAERTLLNLMTHLSGIATATEAWVSAVAGTGCVVRDTRKTLPGLRLLEKYAVRCGGGVNHRLGLGDAALIKDNHVVAAGGIVAAIEAVRSAAPSVALEAECDTLDQVAAALGTGCRLILLDNMGLDDLRAAVALVGDRADVRLEASGGLTLANAREVAETGVDFVAIGALTHSSPALDLGLDLRPV